MFKMSSFLGLVVVISILADESVSLTMFFASLYDGHLSLPKY